MSETMFLSSPLPFLAHSSLFPAEKPCYVDNDIIIIIIINIIIILFAQLRSRMRRTQEGTLRRRERRMAR